MDFSNYLANKLISATVRGVSYSTPPTVYLALYRTDPTKDDDGDSHLVEDGHSYKFIEDKE